MLDFWEEGPHNPRGAADFLKINAKNWFTFHSTTPSLGQVESSI